MAPERRTGALLLVAVLLRLATSCVQAPEPVMKDDWPDSLNAPQEILDLPGYVPHSELSYRGPARELEIVAYPSTGKRPLPEEAAARLEDMQAAAEDVRVIRNDATDRGGHLLVVESVEGGRRIRLGLYWLNLDEHTRLELNYLAELSPEQLVAELEAMAASVGRDLHGAGTLPAKFALRSTGFAWIGMPQTLERRTAFAIRNPAQHTRWRLDAVGLGTASPREPRIALDRDSAMVQLDDETPLGNGTRTLWTVYDPELGEIRERVVRADVVINGVRVVLRGSGPTGMLPALEAELQTLLSRLAPS